MLVWPSSLTVPCGSGGWFRCSGCGECPGRNADANVGTDGHLLLVADDRAIEGDDGVAAIERGRGGESANACSEVLDIAE